jgi:RNA polymerase primary sigma factor
MATGPASSTSTRNRLGDRRPTGVSSARRELLTATEEVELARTIQAGRSAEARQQAGAPLDGDDALITKGHAAKKHFVEANIGLVVHLAGKFPIPSHVDRQDVIHDGVLGLERALEDFDPDRGWRFSTYAAWWVRRTMQRGLETTIAAARIPTHRISDARRVGTDVDLADDGPSALDITAASMLRANSLDAQPAGEHTAGAHETLACSAPGPDDQVLSARDHEIARELLAQLDPDNAALVVARFGLDGSDGSTLTELADQRGVTPEAVRRRILRSLDKLRPHAERLVAA